MAGFGVRNPMGMQGMFAGRAQPMAPAAPGRASFARPPMQKPAPMAAGMQPMAARAAPVRGGFAPQAQPARPTGMGGMMGRALGAPNRAAPAPGGGGFSSFLQRQPPQQQRSLGGLAGAAGMAGGMLSDRNSKREIEDLEDELERTYQALETRAEMPRAGMPHHLDDEFQKPTANRFEYKPEFQDQPGGARGEQTGPMADELEGIPGVVQRRRDGMKQVDPGRLTMANTSQIGTLTREKVDRSEIEALQEQLRALEGGGALSDGEHRRIRSITGGGDDEGERIRRGKSTRR